MLTFSTWKLKLIYRNVNQWIIAHDWPIRTILLLSFTWLGVLDWMISVFVSIKNKNKKNRAPKLICSWNWEFDSIGRYVILIWFEMMIQLLPLSVYLVRCSPFYFFSSSQLCRRKNLKWHAHMQNRKNINIKSAQGYSLSVCVSHYTQKRCKQCDEYECVSVRKKLTNVFSTWRSWRWRTCGAEMNWK